MGSIPITRCFQFAGVAQLVEHLLGKDIRGCCNKWQEVTSPTVNGVSERHLLTSRFPRNWRKVGGNFLMQVLPRKLYRIFCKKVHSDCRLLQSHLPIPGTKEILVVIDPPRLRPSQFDVGLTHNEDFAEILQNVRIAKGRREDPRWLRQENDGRAHPQFVRSLPANWPHSRISLSSHRCSPCNIPNQLDSISEKASRKLPRLIFD